MMHRGSVLAERSGGSVRMAILLTQYGGLEIAEATDKIARAPSLDIAGAHRLADAVAGRDSAIQFDIFNRHALDLLADAASAAALNGERGEGGPLLAGLAGDAGCDRGNRDLQSRPQTTRVEHDRQAARHVPNVMPRL